MKTNSHHSHIASSALIPKNARFAVEAVDFGYGNGHSVFHNLSFHAQPGEFVALLGPSGCGKSTLLNLLSGFLAPTHGRVTIDGRPVRPEMPELGYVFQSPQLFPWLSALDNVRFGLRMADRLSATEQTVQARHYLALVGLEAVAARLPHQLSGGMQQRVSLARSLALSPSLLLMDEPFAALDAISRHSMNEELLRLWAALGQTILFVTHDVDEAIFLADRVIVLAPAPQGIHSELAIDLPRPRRRQELAQLPRFAAYRQVLLERIGASAHSPLAL